MSNCFYYTFEQCITYIRHRAALGTEIQGAKNNTVTTIMTQNRFHIANRCKLSKIPWCHCTIRTTLTPTMLKYECMIFRTSAFRNKHDHFVSQCKVSKFDFQLHLSLTIMDLIIVEFFYIREKISEKFNLCEGYLLSIVYF